MHIITEKMFNARVIRDTYNNTPMFRVSKQLGWSGDELRIRAGQFLEAEQGEIEQINKATSDLLGYKKDELIGKSIRRILPDVKSWDTFLKRVIIPLKENKFPVNS